MTLPTSDSPIPHLIDLAVRGWLQAGGDLDRLPNFLGLVLHRPPGAVALDPVYRSTIEEWQAAGEDEDCLPVFLCAYAQKRQVPAEQERLL